MKNNKKKLTSAESSALLNTLKVRFEKNKDRHKGIAWADVEAKLIAPDSNRDETKSFRH